MKENLEERVLACPQADAALMAKARADGSAMATADGYIAAIAAANGFAVATRDTSPFKAAGASVISQWLTGPGANRLDSIPRGRLQRASPMPRSPCPRYRAAFESIDCPKEKASIAGGF